MISALNRDFPSTVGQLDTAYCSATRNKALSATLAEATTLGQEHSQGLIRVVAAWDNDPDTEYDARTYIGLDDNDDVWMFSVHHGKHWFDAEKEGHQDHGNYGLVYEMKYMWSPLECMGDEFWDEVDDCIGSLIGKKSTRASVDVDGFYPGMV